MDKLYPVSDNIIMAMSGESGDTVQFVEYMSKNIELYKMRNGNNGDIVKWSRLSQVTNYRPMPQRTSRGEIWPIHCEVRFSFTLLGIFRLNELFSDSVFCESAFGGF